MITLLHIAPASNPTFRIAPETNEILDPRDLRSGLPELRPSGEAIAYGFSPGFEGLDVAIGGFPLDPVAWIRDGHAAGPDERAAVSEFARRAPTGPAEDVEVYAARTAFECRECGGEVL